jgi:lysophospholipase L1-like esterase
MGLTRTRDKSYWESKNLILAPGEVGFEFETGKSKIGNGHSRWNDLPYTSYPVFSVPAVVPTPPPPPDVSGDIAASHDTDTEREAFVPARLSEAALRAALVPIRDGRPGNRFVYLGDSKVRGSEVSLVTPISGSSGSLAVSWPMFAAWYAGGKIRHVRNLAISGEAAGQGLARFDADVPQWAPDVVHLGYGVNDSSQGGGTIAYQNNIRALVAKVRGIGAMPVLETITPVTGAGPQQRTYIATWNQWLQRYAMAEGIPIVDFASLLIDPATGNLGTQAASGDGTHPGTAGYALMGQHYAAVIGPLLKPRPLSTAKSNTDPTNLIANGMFLLDTNADGRADSWTVYGSPSVGTPTYSIVADAAVPGGKMQRIAVSGTTGSASLFQQINSGAATFTPGDLVDFSCLMTASGTNRTQFQLVFYNGGASIGDLVEFFGQAMTRAPVEITITVPANCTAIQVVLLAGGGTGNCDFGAVTAFNRTKQSVLTP